MAALEEKQQKPSILDSKFPVILPYFPELCVSDGEFKSFIRTLKPKAEAQDVEGAGRPATKIKTVENEPKSAFMEGLLASDTRVHDKESLAAENKTLTKNQDVAVLDTGSPLVEIFYHFTADARVDTDKLSAAWKQDPLATLKIIFNARSIHLGKSDRISAYLGLGWLYQNHPQTLLMNLPWLVRPIIPKPSPKKEEKVDESPESEIKEEVMLDIDDDEFEIIVTENDKLDTTDFDVANGMAHGYWKDLLNVLALAAEDELSAQGNPKKVLNVQAQKDKRRREWDQDKAKDLRLQKKVAQHAKVVEKLNTDPVYRALHFTVARLFASQLQRDLVLLKSGKKEDLQQISLAAKWAPSLAEFHDKTTFVTPTIAECLFPNHESTCPPGVPKADRETYLKHARLKYRVEVLGQLRKALDIVERKITAETFTDIKYDRLPSLAMDRYQSLFLKKDNEHFKQYLEKVASGKAKISGAVLLPSTLVARVLGGYYSHTVGQSASIDSMAEEMLIDGQWKSLVQRIKDSGKMESAIAVCDVSGSMFGPLRSDNTVPVHSAIGLALLLAEVTEPPFGGSIITFSDNPSVVKVGGPTDTRSFQRKVNFISRAKWAMSTNFVSVFKDLILKVAVEAKLPQEQMVKKVFVFSDMQFNRAQNNRARWSTSYERIKEDYKEAGYEMPELVFWNLAGGGTQQGGAPVSADEKGTALVSGYSQAMMKVFLDGGGFDEEEEQVEIEIDEEEDSEDEGDEEKLVKVKKVKTKTDPLAVVKKAISHRAYRVLKVVD
jgi:hypothetical protein